jgi:predicted ATP-grasp superfamily ATP-dependent carboligase
MNKVIAIISPAASAKYMAEQFRLNNIKTIIVEINQELINPALRVPSNLFDIYISLSHPTLDQIIDELTPYNVDYIINGYEGFTHLTDKLNSVLLPHFANNPNTTTFRADKYFMQIALKSQRLPYVKQIKINTQDFDPESLSKVLFPCFCKPTQAAGSVGAFRAENKVELIGKLNVALKKGYEFDLSEYLVQEFVVGTEYLVDTFSADGIHYISSVQKYVKELINGIPVYRQCMLVDSKKIWDKCSDFVKKALTATEFKHGFAHTEIFIMENSEPRLIEINPRISGAKGFCNRLAQLSGAKSQTDLLISYLNNNLLEETHFNQLTSYGEWLILYNGSNTPLKDPSVYLKDISSVKYHEFVKGKIGDVSHKSKEITLMDMDLLVLLNNISKKQLEKDTQLIFELENSGKII